MKSSRTDTASFVFALQGIVDGRDADEVIDHVLINMTRRKDAPALVDGRARRRIESRLRHRSANYVRLCRELFDIFAQAIEEEGLKVHPDFADDRDIVHPSLEKILEAAQA